MYTLPPYGGKEHVRPEANDPEHIASEKLIEPIIIRLEFKK